MERYGSIKGRRAGRAPLSFIPQSGIALRDPSLPPATLDRGARDRIGRELRALYTDLARQPVPQRLLDLIGRLEGTKGQS
jgi:hypothetical protein